MSVRVCERECECECIVAVCINASGLIVRMNSPRRLRKNKNNSSSNSGKQLARFNRDGDDVNCTCACNNSMLSVQSPPQCSSSSGTHATAAVRSGLALAHYTHDTSDGAYLLSTVHCV